MAPNPEKVQKVSDGLLGAVLADSSIDAATQTAKIDEIVELRSTANGQPSAAGQVPTDAARETAWSELQAMDRAPEIPRLDNAAKILAGVTALITGLFVGIGFTTGDFVRMIRDFWPQGFTFLLLSGLALFLGTFAFLIDAYRSQRNLNFERGAIYLGIACAGVAFGLAAWGISQGASSGPTRPAITASFDTTSSTPALKISINSSDVARSNHLTATVWGKSNNGWEILNYVVSGPDHNGAIVASITVNNVTSYSQIQATASLESIDSAAVPSPPSKCPSNTSCVILIGFPGSSPTPTPTATSSKLLRPEKPGRWVMAGGVRGRMASTSCAGSDRGHRVPHYKRSCVGVGVALVVYRNAAHLLHLSHRERLDADLLAFVRSGD